MAAVAASPLAAYDHIFGARLDLNAEAPEMQGTVFAVTTTDSFSLWYEGSWNDMFNIEADAAVVYEADYRLGIAFDTLDIGYLGSEAVWYPDVRALNVFGQAGRFYYRAGRQTFQDPGLLVISNPSDGILFGAQLAGMTLDFQGGYTGLVNYNATSVTMTVNDLVSDTWGSPRLLEKVSWSWPGILRQMSLSASLIAQQELRDTADMLEGSEKLNSQYLEVMADGFLLAPLAYRLTAVGQTGSYGDDISLLAGIGRMELTFLPRRSNAAMGIDLIYSTGDSWDRGDYYASSIAEGKDKLNQYMPISTVSSLGFVEVFELGNITTLGAFFSINPSDKFSAELRGTTFLRTSAGPVSSSLVIDDGNDEMFIGQEGLLSFFFRPVSDVGFSIKTGVLYRGDIVTIPEELEPYFPVLMRVGFDLSLSF